ncbi:uncharacterized protein LOC119778938 [Cyprinodon tularosa]|uniref:uncharacterized protein LOC119778938 n=1 Tax=Cyprinodon tularosa TaxID=77115 RepID=UPI0018E1FDD5|nr:uncharacterized protein LOC119778938 [Cyprinodon tularosa]
MVKACDYPGCANKIDGKSLSFHRFPLTDVAVRKLWLLALGFHVDTRLEKIKKLRVCSAHFSEDDFVSSCPRDTKKRILKSSAVPATLACAPVAMAETAQSKAATSEEEPALQSTPLKSRLDKQQFQMMLTSPADAGPSKKPSTSGTYIALPPTGRLSQSENPSSDVAPETLDTTMTSIETPVDRDDSTFLELSSDDTSTRSSSSDNIAGAERRGDWSERKWIVNESCLMELFTTCHTCGISICEKKITSRGSKIKIEWTCINHHMGVWESCPDVRGIPENNLVSSAAIIFTGTTQNEIEEWADLLNLQLLKRTAYYSLQSTYMIPVIQEAYTEMQEEILSELRETEAAGGHTDICGDARSDSPGYSAKYTCYSFMEDATKKVIMSDLIQVTEATSSTAMEPVGFRRGLDRLLDSGVGVYVVTTDRAPSIRKIMRESYPELRHQFDPWHVAKGIKKKATALARKKENRDLQPWIKSLGNHFWWSCSSCGGDEKELKHRWTSILYHVCGIHRWEENDQEYRCRHEDISEEQQRRKKWLEKGCPAWNALKSVVLDKNLLRDLSKMTLFKHTGALEVLHSSMLKYAEKRRHFKNIVIIIVISLLIYRQEKYNVIHSRQSNQWVARKLYEPTTQEFRKELVERVIRRRLDKNVRLGDPAFHVHPPVSIPANIAPTPKPNKADLVAEHASRFPTKNTGDTDVDV